MKWKERIDRFRAINTAKRERVIEQLIKSCMGAQQRCFIKWTRWIDHGKAKKIAGALSALTGENTAHKAMATALKLQDTLQKIGRRPHPVQSRPPTADMGAVSPDMAMSKPGRRAAVSSGRPAPGAPSGRTSGSQSPDAMAVGPDGMSRPRRGAPVRSGRPGPSKGLHPQAGKEGGSIYLF